VSASGRRPALIFASGRVVLRYLGIESGQETRLETRNECHHRRCTRKDGAPAARRCAENAVRRVILLLRRSVLVARRAVASTMTNTERMRARDLPRREMGYR
jgi:hypothetical protein